MLTCNQTDQAFADSTYIAATNRFEQQVFEAALDMIKALRPGTAAEDRRAKAMHLATNALRQAQGMMR